MSDATDKAIEAGTKIATDLAGTLKAIAPEAWRAMVAGHRINGVVSLVAVLTATLGSGYWFYKGLRAINGDESFKEDLWYPVTIISGFVFFVALCGCLFGGPSFATDAFVPEYGALRELLGK